uniref:hypothetical protein n=1 Tax=Cephaleuros parasiticus TaxID=173370 RepID=UPI001EDDABA7|nr:hypothetical protein MFQ79_pgp031 [Cephaleuros parasiticus]UIB39031.1 hypothetical protein [Cephaleuros parasiticus]
MINGKIYASAARFGNIGAVKKNLKLGRRRNNDNNIFNGILLIYFPEKIKLFFVQTLAAEKKIPLIVQSANLLFTEAEALLEYSNDKDRIQTFFEKIKFAAPCVCFLNDLEGIGERRKTEWTEIKDNFGNRPLALPGSSPPGRSSEKNIKLRGGVIEAGRPMSLVTPEDSIDSPKLRIPPSIIGFAGASFGNNSIASQFNDHSNGITY